MENVEKIKPTGLFTNYIYKTIPLAFNESMSYYETLCGLLAYLRDTVIPAVDNNANAIIEVQNLYNELKNYVDHYFDNLDIQEEINNKLDDMAESGQLTDIIAQYLQLAGVLAYDTKASMKSAENLVNGSICRTLGNSTYSDGQGHFYRVREIINTDVVDDDNIIALHDEDLVAVKIPDYYLNQVSNRVTQLEEFFEDYDIIVDINGNGDYTSLATAVTNANDGDIIYVKKGTYNNEIVNCIGKNLTIVGEDKNTTIIQNGYDDYYREPLTIAKGKVKNLTIKQIGTDPDTSIKSYAVHIDNNESKDSELIFDNCYFYSLTHASVGIGLRPNFNLVFNDCTFRSDHNLTPQNEHRGALFVHNANSVDYLGFNQNLTLNNCKLSTLYGSVIHFEHCYNKANNQANVFVYNTDIYSDELGVKKGLITQENNATSSDNSIVLSNRNGGNNYATLNNSLYTTGVGYTNVVGKFENNEIQNEIKRLVININVTAGQLGSLDLTDYSVTKFIAISGILTVNDGGVFPLSHNGDNAGNNISCWGNNTDKTLAYYSYLAGTMTVYIDYI